MVELNSFSIEIRTHLVTEVKSSTDTAVDERFSRKFKLKDFFHKKHCIFGEENLFYAYMRSGIAEI